MSSLQCSDFRLQYIITTEQHRSPTGRVPPLILRTRQGFILLAIVRWGLELARRRSAEFDADPKGRRRFLKNSFKIVFTAKRSTGMHPAR